MNKFHYMVLGGGGLCNRDHSTTSKTTDIDEVTCVACRRELCLPSKKPAPIRSIRLTLAKDTTATECGQCPCRIVSSFILRCQAFQKDLLCNIGGRTNRLPECRAAETT